MTLFGRNFGTATGPAGTVPVESARFYAVTDTDGGIAVYDSSTGQFAPGLDADAAYDFNNDGDDPDKYQWKASL